MTQTGCYNRHLVVFFSGLWLSLTLNTGPKSSRGWRAMKDPPQIV
jgi:hypothetical protein